MNGLFYFIGPHVHTDSAMHSLRIQYAQTATQLQRGQIYRLHDVHHVRPMARHSACVPVWLRDRRDLDNRNQLLGINSIDSVVSTEDLHHSLSPRKELANVFCHSQGYPMPHWGTSDKCR